MHNHAELFLQYDQAYTGSIKLYAKNMAGHK